MNSKDFKRGMYKTEYLEELLEVALSAKEQFYTLYQEELKLRCEFEDMQERFEEGIGNMRTLLEYIEEFEGCVDMKVVKADIGETIARMQCTYT